MSCLTVKTGDEEEGGAGTAAGGAEPAAEPAAAAAAAAKAADSVLNLRLLPTRGQLDLCA